MMKNETRNIEMHIQLLALLIAAGTVLFSTALLIGGLVLLPVVFFAPFSKIEAGGPMEAGLLGLGSLAILFAVGNLILGLSAAYGLMKRRPWGRTLAIMDSTVSLLSFPIGTLFGVYGLWVLLPSDAVQYLAGDDIKQLKIAQ